MFWRLAYGLVAIVLVLFASVDEWRGNAGAATLKLVFVGILMLWRVKDLP